MTDAEYWRECIETALDECGLTATDEQVAYLSDAVSGAHECYSMAFGYDVASSNRYAALEREKRELNNKLRHESEKRDCPECRGSGRLKYNAGPWAVNTGCSTCHGEGKMHPSQL